jgi:hypothetical protein
MFDEVNPMRTRTWGGVSKPQATCVLAALVLLASAGVAQAQTAFVPYFGKNLVRWSRFDWRIYPTDHFEIYYYPSEEKHLERIAGYAESAYQQVSAELKHDLAFKVPLIVFKTHTEFEQENVIPGAAEEGVGAFAEPTRNRMLLPLDEPSDLLYRLIVHELTHIFEFDIIPQSLIRDTTPLWMNEGLSDYMTGYWAPLDLATVRDAAVADIIPKMSKLEGYGDFTNPRIIYNLGHAAFEFIESRWGKDGLRQFLFALRKNVIGGGASAYEEALKLKPEEFDQQFEKYLKDRFKPFRDKERPADYGRDLAPNKEKTRFVNALSAEPSPSGDLFAVMTANRKDGELDVILTSAKDGQVVSDLTPGFDRDMGFENISMPGSRWNTVSWMSWSPGGDRLAYFVRKEGHKTLIIENILTRTIEQRIEMKTIDEPESPNIAPGGKIIAFAGLRDAKSDIYTMNLDTREITNLTNDDFADFAPAFSLDGRSIVYVSRISGNDKLFRLDLDTKKKTQITFGTHDDAAARFVDADTIVFASTATDPAQPIDPEVAKNGNIYNIWTLSLKTGELRQYTDALGANVSPVVFRDSTGPRIAFITYYKGEYGLHTLDRKEPVHTVASADFGAPGPVIDFQAPLNHTLVKGNIKTKHAFDKLFLDGRPPINVGVTSNGDIFGGSEISFSDVLGDRRINFFGSSIMEYQTFGGSYVDVAHRFQYALQGFSQSLFYYGNLSGLLYDPAYAPYVSRKDALSTQKIYGGLAFGIYPLDIYRRLEMSAGVLRYSQSYNNNAVQAIASQYQLSTFGTPLIQSGSFVPFSVAFVQETTLFREFGPLSGNTVRVSYEVAPKIAGTLSRQTLDVDARKYLRIAGSGLFALRARGYRSWGAAPNFLYFGGNSEMRGYDYLEFIGQNAVFANAELRYPIIEAMLTPIGVLGGVRGVFFFNIGGGWFNNTNPPYRFATSKPATVTPVTYTSDPVTGLNSPVMGQTVTVTGFRLQDARASYGVGFETFLLGLPLHFDWSWRTTFNKGWEDVLFAGQGGSAAFRKARFGFWIGYDF